MRNDKREFQGPSRRDRKKPKKDGKKRGKNQSLDWKSQRANLAEAAWS